MCGIGGIILTDRRKKMPKEIQLQSVGLLQELESRGSHAWGVYLKKVGKNYNLYCGKKDESLGGELYKTPGSVSEFLEEEDNRINLNGTNTILMHTRAYTVGDPEINENNHPFNTENFILSHNGGISNDTSLRNKYNVKSNIECDSYIIIELIQHFYDENGGDVVKAIKSTVGSITGGFACWLYHKDTKEVYLFRSSNPIEYYHDEDNGIFYFASLSSYLRKVLEDVKVGDTNDVPSGEILKITKDGLKKLDEFETGYSRCNTGSCGVTGNVSRTSSSRSPIDINLSKVDKSLVYLYELFENYEEDNKIRTVIAITNNTIILMVKPKDLIKKLDEAGFDEFKDKDSTMYQSNYYQYVINPPEKINELVSKLKGENIDDIDNELSKVKIGEIRDKIKELDETELEKEFYSNFPQTMDMLGMHFSMRGGKVNIKYEGNNIPDYIIDTFKSIGKPISKVTGKMSMKLGVTHLRDLVLLTRIVGDDLDND